MSHFDLPAASRRRTWAGAAASAVLVGLLAVPLPAHAQINGWMNQMNPWGPTYNQHTATNIMTPRMNYTPPVTIPQTLRQFNPQFNAPPSGYFPSYYPQMPSPYYPSYPQNFGQGYGTQYQQYQAQGPVFYPAAPSQPQRTTRLLPPADPPKPTAPTGPGGIRMTTHQSPRGGTVTLPGSNIPIRGFGADTPTGYQNNFPYASIPTNTAPAFLGGYYYGNYTDTYCAGGGYAPSVYSVYSGLPQYIYNAGTGLTVVGDPYYPVYTTPYQAFSEPSQVTYNQTNNQYNQYNYYGTEAGGARRAEDGTDGGRAAVPTDSFQAAFADIERAWKNGDLTLLRSHIRDSDTRISVYFQGKYSYSIASGDFVQITRDAFDRLRTVSFQFTRLRKAKNGDVTAYGKQVYRTSGDAAGSGSDLTTKADTVPFRTDGTQPSDDAKPYDRAGDPAGGQEKTVYVSYILRRYDDRWAIIGVDTSPTELAK